jgi:hypothetical protein
MLPGGIRTHNLSRRAAAVLRLRPRGHWDRLRQIIQRMIIVQPSGSDIFIIRPIKIESTAVYLPDNQLHVANKFVFLIIKKYRYKVYRNNYDRST